MHYSRRVKTFHLIAISPQCSFVEAGVLVEGGRKSDGRTGFGLPATVARVQGTQCIGQCSHKGRENREG